MHKWRLAEVVEMDKRSSSRVLVHFANWSSRHDIWLDLQKDWDRLAPVNRLLQEDCLAGVPLQGALRSEMRDVVFRTTGIKPIDDLPPARDPSLGCRVEAINPSSHTHADELEGQSPRRIPAFDPQPGDAVDVLDQFTQGSSRQREFKEKWRASRIVDRRGDMCLVHYLGWEAEWDTYVDLGSGRIAPSGSNVQHPRDGERPASSSSSRRRSNNSSSFSKGSPSKLRRHGAAAARNAQFARGRGVERSPVSAGKHRFAPPHVDSFTSVESRFEAVMRRNGLHIVEQLGDGNCLFRAVCHQCYQDASRHAELRERVADHMEQHRERFETFVTVDFCVYLERIRRLGVWADDLEIRAVEEILDRGVEIYVAETEPVDGKIEPLKTHFDEAELLHGVDPIKISYHGQAHYNSVVDERTPLPLPPRHSHVITASRQRQHGPRKKAFFSSGRPRFRTTFRGGGRNKGSPVS